MIGNWFFVDDDFPSTSSNFHPLTDFLNYATHKKHVRSTKNPKKRENIRKSAEGRDRKNRDPPCPLIWELEYNKYSDCLSAAIER